MSGTDGISDESTLVSDSVFTENIVLINENHIETEPLTFIFENIAGVQTYYLDSFNNGTVRNEVKQVQIGLSEHDRQLITNIHDNNINNFTQIVLPNEPDEIKKDTTQIIVLGDENEYQTITVKEIESKYFHHILQMNQINDTLEDNLDPDDPVGGDLFNLNDKEDPSKKILKIHTKSHDQTISKPYQCKSCPSKFTSSGSLKRHVKYKHTHERPHKCTYCDYSCVELAKMRSHLRCHTGERPYKCPHCTYASKDAFRIKRHLLIHTGEKPFECDICFSRFVQSSSLKQHRLKHIGVKPEFKCDRCPTICRRRPDLRIHIQNFHTTNKPIMCKLCNKTFPDVYQHKVHCKSHKGEKIYKCVLCPYASNLKRYLKTHILKHTDEKQFHCETCNRGFRQKELLRHHNNVYHNPSNTRSFPHETTHQCNTCKISFEYKENLMSHIQIHVQDSTENNNTALKQKLEENKDSVNENKSEKKTCAEDVVLREKYVLQHFLLDGLQPNGQYEMDDYLFSTLNQSEPTILRTVSLSDINEECGEFMDNSFSFDD